MAPPISHALVLPDRDFRSWYRAVEDYTRKFERVVVVRSPAGNDLNRFRNITAVQTPNVWFMNDAVRHIRMIYPSVVLVDLIEASTPDQLEAELQTRIDRSDRYGEQSPVDHLYERFTIGWPSDEHPVRVTRKFNDLLPDGRRHPGISIDGGRDDILAVAGGTVNAISETADFGRFIQVTTNYQGTRYNITYADVAEIRVSLGEIVERGKKIAKADGVFTLYVQQPGSGRRGYWLANVTDPTLLVYWDGLRLQPTEDGLRVRERPGVDFKALGQVYKNDLLEPLETHGRALQRLGRTNEWTRIRTDNGIEGFTAAWFLDATTATDAPVPPPTNVNLTGINVDFTNRLGKPDPARLGDLTWVRLPYDLSRNTGSTDIDSAEQIYRPLIRAYAEAGYRVILVFTHETYGEARYNWNEMNRDRWRELTAAYKDICREIARRYAGRGWVGAYQVWNEQDTPPWVASAAVPMPSTDYGYLLGETIRSIRTVDTSTPIITGGHVTGAGDGVRYASATLANISGSVRPDGIALHPYGLGAPGSSARYAPFGQIGPTVRAFLGVMNEPVWITEWGVLNLQNDPAADVAQYATRFIEELRLRHSDEVVAACWYAWSDSMHNGYGLVNSSDQPKQPLHDQYRAL